MAVAARSLPSEQAVIQHLLVGKFSDPLQDESEKIIMAWIGGHIIVIMTDLIHHSHGIIQE